MLNAFHPTSVSYFTFCRILWFSLPSTSLRKVYRILGRSRAVSHDPSRRAPQQESRSFDHLVRHKLRLIQATPLSEGPRCTGSSPFYRIRSRERSTQIL